MLVEDIIQGCKEGNRKSQDALVQKFAPVLMAICVRYTSDNDLAKDALQETFINAFKYLYSFAGTGSFEGWLRRVAVTTCIALNKRHKKLSYDEMSNIDEFRHSTIPDIYSKLNAEELLKIISQLPPSLLTVFNLYVIDGYTHAEISKMVNITESTSRSALTKARVKLIDIIGKSEKKTVKWAAAL
jgi:RNA polymerase sigma factor (sigma-70 family)